MTQIQMVHPQSERNLLVLFDHDGTICQTNENAYESIKYGLREAAALNRLDISSLENNWDQFFHETRGTTEEYAVKVVYNQSGGNPKNLKEFSKIYYQARANWYQNMKSYSEYTYDTYYPDAENLIFQCWKTPNIHIGLVTGNPEATMRQRLAQHLQELFFDTSSYNTFGNEASSREELILLSIGKAQSLIPNFTLVKDSHGIIQNVIYVGDSRADLFAGLLARVRTLWVPSRMLQTVKDAKSEDAIGVLTDLFPNSIHITNNLEAKDALGFVLD